jgi:hypothetical protein
VYQALLLACGLAFFATVPLLLMLHARRPQQMPWWLVVVMSVVLIWCIRIIHGYVETQAIDSSLNELRRQNPYVLADYWRGTDPPRELRWGWAMGVGYLALCLGPYWVVRTIMTRRFGWRSLAGAIGGAVIAGALYMVSGPIVGKIRPLVVLVAVCFLLGVTLDLVASRARRRRAP